jgi:hypothetical protein
MNKKECVKILDLLQAPRKMVTKSMDAGQTKWDGKQTEWLSARANLVAQGQLGRFAVKTGDNRHLTVIDLLLARRARQANSNTTTDSNIIDQSSRLTNALIQRKANYMKQYFRRGFLSLIV